jgi:hypothetical protein
MKRCKLLEFWNPTRALAFLLPFFMLIGLNAPLRGQSCDQIPFLFENATTPCQFRMTYDNASECYTQIRISLEQGAFVNWVPATGFQVQVISTSELWITHTGGFLPLGFQVPLTFTLPVGLNTNIGLAYINNCPPGVGCEIFGGIPIESCPDLQNASVTGTVYRECGLLPLSNQPIVPGYTVQLLNTAGDVLSEQVTDDNGAYAFTDLPLGVYWVKLAGTGPGGGWSPNIPASGQYANVQVTPSQ